MGLVCVVQVWISYLPVWRPAILNAGWSGGLSAPALRGAAALDVFALAVLSALQYGEVKRDCVLRSMGT